MHTNFPLTFDYAYYNSTNNLSMTPEKAYLHFLHVGKTEGLVGSKYARRKEFLHFLRGLDCKSILEIGPGANPCFFGDNVKYFDFQNEAELAIWAERQKLKTVNLPQKIHYVSKKCDMSIITEKFELIFSGHNIEHQISIADHLQSASNLLCENGLFALIIPDKRYCFDHFKPLTTIIDVLSGYYSTTKNTHPLKTYLTHLMLGTHNDPIEHWKGNHGHVSKSVDLKLVSERYLNLGHYLDCHAHFFTPDTFEEIIYQLFYQNFIDLEPIRVFYTPHNTFEFCAILKKSKK